MTQDVNAKQSPTTLMTAKYVAEQLSQELGGEVVRGRGGNWGCRCPCHDDDRNSLSLTDGTVYNVTGKCFAGCSFDSIREALEERGLFARKPRRRKYEDKGQYDYHDENGQYVFTKQKLVDEDGKKTFKIQVRDPEATSGYRTGMPKGLDEVPLYNLPALLASPIEEDAPPVFIVEGEKDVETLRSYRILAVSNHDGGGGEWRDEYVRWLAGRDLIILPDNDATGRKHAATVAKAMEGHATSVRILELPGLPEHGDVTDWLEDAGHTVDELEELLGEPEQEFQPPWQDQLLRSDRGNLLNVDTNYYLMLTHHPEMAGRLRFNWFADRVELDGKTLDEEVALYDTQCWLQCQGLGGDKTKTWDTIYRVAKANGYDPLREYVESLQWDGVERLGSWLYDYCGAGGDEADITLYTYQSLVGRRWMVGAIKRWLEPGSKVEQMLILEGPQGAGKSAMVRALAPHEDWFLDTLPQIETQYKDAVIALKGHCLVEVAEMEAVRKSTRESVKKFLSVQVDKIRKPYARETSEYARRCVLVGTHNSDGEGYLTDPTGNRRYLPVTVGKIDLEGIRRDRDQLWAEAKHLYEQGEQHWLDATDVGVLEAQRARYKASELADLIWQYIEYEADAEPAVDARDAPKVTWTKRPEPLDLFIPKYFWGDLGRGDWLKAGYKERQEVNGVLQNAGWTSWHGRDAEQAEAHGDHPRLKLRGWKRPESGYTSNGPSSVPTKGKKKDPAEQSSIVGYTGGETAAKHANCAPSVPTSGPSENSHAFNDLSPIGYTGYTTRGKRLEVDRNPPVEGEGERSAAQRTFCGDKCTHTLSRLGEFLDRHREHVIGCDIETTALRPQDGRVRLLQLSRDGDGLVLDLDEVGGLSALREYLSGLTLVAFNAQFEYQWFLDAGIDDVQWEDAKLAHAAIAGGGLSLKECVQKYLGRTRDKGLQKSDWSGELSQAQLDYALQDAQDAWELWQHLVPLMEQHDCMDGYLMLMESLPALATMQARGMRFDLQRHAEMVEQWQQESDAALERLRQLVPEVDNWNSPVQVAAWLKDSLARTRLRRLWPRTAGGQLSTGKQAIAEMLDHPGLPEPVREALSVYQERQRTANYLKTFGPRLAAQVRDDGRLYGFLKIASAITGRMSSSEPNLQNMPTKYGFRDLFIAAPDHSIVVADYSQIEVRVGGLLADEPEIERITKAGIDVHTGSAALMYHKDAEDVTPAERKVAKGVTFGMQYGMGTKALAKILSMTHAEAEEVQRKWLQRYPEIAKWREEQVRHGTQQHELRTAGNRRIELPPNPSPSTCYNYPVQGSAGDVMYRALHFLNQRLDGVEGIYPLTVVHDEVVLECESDKVGLAKSLLEQAMVEGFLDVFPNGDTTGLVDADAGTSWGAKS